MDHALMRYVGQDHDSPFVLRYLRWAAIRCLLISLVAATILWAGRPWFETLFDATGLAGVLAGITLAVPAHAFGFLLSGFFKGIRKPATACLLENGSVALVAGMLILAWEKVGDGSSLTTIGYAYAVAAWLVVLQGGYQVWRWCHRQTWWLDRSNQALASTGAQASLGQFTATSRAFFMINLAGFMQQVLGVMIAGWLLSSAELGLFKASQQTSVLIGFVLIVLNAVFPPRFASLYRQGKIDALGRLARQGALLGVVVAAPLLLLCLLFPGWVLGWFGEGFGDGEWLLRIIAIAQAVNVSTGSVSFLLNMTGHERLARNIALICNALGLLAFFVLIPPFGAFGAALALAFVLVVQNLATLLFVWRRLGIWTLPGPNLLALMGMKSSVVP
ncbi:lipopolysaccharide biosynthesis protein [Alloalcanivorax balearicus]|nr:lipopolysaccharide biosynthesis protein [Alloalcanivorax balearicus]